MYMHDICKGVWLDVPITMEDYIEISGRRHHTILIIGLLIHSSLSPHTAAPYNYIHTEIKIKHSKLVC